MTSSDPRPPWAGDWVVERLGVSIDERGQGSDLAVRELVGLALRRNPRRAHLLVSRVLGKHVPVAPMVATAVGRALGRRVAALLEPSVAPVPARLMHEIVHAVEMRDIDDAPVAVGLVLGYAETATALGHQVADVLGAPYLHSTRRRVPGIDVVAGFEEGHSHATAHLLTPTDPALLDGGGPVVLVDDELSTGATALRTIEALQARRHRDRYVIACLVDVRDGTHHADMEAAADRLGCRIDVVALAAGRLGLPADALDRAAGLIAATSTATPQRAAGAVRRVVVPLPEVEGVRHGFDAAARMDWTRTVPDVAAVLAAALRGDGRIHVLGTEEFMALPLAVARDLQRLLPGASVTFSSTTRSPAAAIDSSGYAIRDVIEFPAHDGPADANGTRYAYNLRTEAPDVVVVMPDRAGDTEELTGLTDAVRRIADRVVVASGSAR